jgi:hypothetical protein
MCNKEWENLFGLLFRNSCPIIFKGNINLFVISHNSSLDRAIFSIRQRLLHVNEQVNDHLRIQMIVGIKLFNFR